MGKWLEDSRTCSQSGETSNKEFYFGDVSVSQTGQIVGCLALRRFTGVQFISVDHIGFC
jgi:hypothetical protein